ncbi:MAG: TetR/AcrR family transcriptional regulator [Mycobacteriaceae bacterium]|nr:TetR/AcrR family transcriptional regulator [Mycobacteriaceae bacterium]
MNDRSAETPRRRGRPPRVQEDMPTRARIVNAAARLMRRNGYHAMGLNDVVSSGRAPKGSLYHYFPGGKEQIAGEALRTAGQRVTASITTTLSAGGEVAENLRSFAQLLADDLERSEFRNGCPIATTTLDAASDSDVIQSAAAKCFAEWHDTLAEWLRTRGHSATDAAELAALLVAAFEGALLTARAHRSSAPIHDIAETLARRLSL